MPYQNNWQPTYTPSYPSMNTVQRTQGNLIWINGLDGAKAYPMMPNTNVILLDSTAPYAYLKFTDAANFPTIERFKIIKDPIVESSETAPLYATHEEVALLSSKIDNIASLLGNKEITNEQSNTQQSTTTAKYSEPHYEQTRLIQGSDDGGYQNNLQSNAGQPSTEW